MKPGIPIRYERVTMANHHDHHDTHSVLIGYLLWIFGFTGAHRFYYGKPITGTIWFFTLGLLLIGWIIDLFSIPGMDRRADFRYQDGHLDYSAAWLLLVFGDLRRPSVLHGQMDHGDHLLAHGWTFRAGTALRPVDAEWEGERDQPPRTAGVWVKRPMTCQLLSSAWPRRGR